MSRREVRVGPHLRRPPPHVFFDGGQPRRFSKQMAQSVETNLGGDMIRRDALRLVLASLALAATRRVAWAAPPKQIPASTTDEWWPTDRQLRQVTIGFPLHEDARKRMRHGYEVCGVKRVNQMQLNFSTRGHGTIAVRYSYFERPVDSDDAASRIEHNTRLLQGRFGSGPGHINEDTYIQVKLWCAPFEGREPEVRVVLSVDKSFFKSVPDQVHRVRRT